VLWAFYPALVVFSIVATANHFFLDAAGGAGVAMLAALAVYAAHTRSRRLAAVLVAAPVASFLVYRFAGRAGQAADTLAAVAVGTLALAMAANLVSVWLKAAVWRRTLDAVEGAPVLATRDLVSVWLKAAVWRRALAAVPNAPALTTRELLPSVFIGFLFNTVLVARLGELARVAVLTRRIRRTGSQLPVTAVAGTLVAEQIVLGAALVLIGAGLALTIVDLPAWADSTLMVLGALTGGAVIAGILAKRTQPTLPSRLTRLAGPARELRGSLRIMRDPRRLAVALALGAGSWAAQIAGIYWTLDAFGLPHTIASASAVFLVSTLVGVVPLMPGNVGVFQLAVAGVLASSFGISAASGAAFAIGLQATEIVLGAGIGALFLLAEGVSFTELRRAAPAPAAVTPCEADDRHLAYAA
jgi:uncharacterized membrane protein YbhN (UPF0104 family)